MTETLAVKILNVLRDDTDVFALVGTRIFPDHAPDMAVAKPFIVWIDTAGKAEESMDQLNDFDMTEVRFNCYSDNKLQAMQVRTAVRKALTAVGALPNVTVTLPQTRGFYEDKVSLDNSIIELTFEHNPSET